MPTLTTHGPVVQAEFSTWRSRAVGYGVSCYLTRGMVVDTAFPSVAGEFLRWLRATRPDGVIVTHAHEDHAGNLDQVVRAGVPLHAAPETMAAVRAMPRPGPYRLWTWGVPRGLPAAPISFRPAGLVLIQAPGHSPDHHVVWDAEREHLFGGDLFVGVRIRVARPDEDPRAAVRSLRAAAALRPRVLFDAHRGAMHHPVPSLLAKAAWLEETIGAVDRRLAEGWSDRATAREVLGAEQITGYLSLGDMTRLNFVRALRRTGNPPSGETPMTDGPATPATGRS